MQIIVNLTDAADIRESISFLQSRLGPVATHAVPVVSGPATVPNGPSINTLAPQATATVTTTNDRDAEGLPWDERIHAATKTKTAKNVWTRRKGIEDATYESVRAQLRGLSAAPGNFELQNGVPVVVPTPPPVVPAAPAPAPPPAVILPPPFPPDGWTVHPDAAGYYYKDQEVLTEADLRARFAPVAAPTIVAPPAGTVVDWPYICSVMNPGLASGKWNVESLNAIAGKYGVTPFAMLATKPETWPAVLADLSA